MSLHSHDRAASLTETIHCSIFSCLRAAKLPTRVWNCDICGSCCDLLSGERRRDRTAYGCTIFYSEFPVRPARSYILFLPLSLSFLLSCTSRIRNDQRTEHTNGGFDDPNGRPNATNALTIRYDDALFEYGARLVRARLAANREVEQHRCYPSYRGIPRFVNIPPNRFFRRRESRNAAVWLVARGRSFAPSCNRQDVTPPTAGGRSSPDGQGIIQRVPGYVQEL